MLVCQSWQTTTPNRFWHRRKHSIEIDSDRLQHEFDANAALPIGNIQLNPDVVDSPSSSLEVQNAQSEQNVREECAATCIQTAFRGFLVIRFFIISFELGHHSAQLKYYKFLWIQMCIRFPNEFI